MDEQFETFDRAGRLTGCATRARVHREGLWHRAANVLLFDPDGRLLVQQRSSTRDVCPGAWDLSVAEHLKPGETYEAGAARGIREELGVETGPLLALGGVRESRVELDDPPVRDFELQQSFRGVLHGRVTVDRREVSDVHLIDLDDLAAAMAERPGRFTPWFRNCAVELGIVGGASRYAS